MNDTIPMDSIREADAARLFKFVAMIRGERESQGMTVEQLAERADVDAAALYNLEAGQAFNPTVATLFRIAAALGKNLALGFESDDSPALARKNVSSSLTTSLVVALAMLAGAGLACALAAEVEDLAGEDIAIVVLTVGLFGAIFVPLIMSEMWKKRCELCGKWGALKKTGKQLIKKEKAQRLADWEERVPVIRSIYRKSYRCVRCGHETYKQVVDQEDDVGRE
jgi:transcriptional regulator with XRE-family HTH domain